jgi:hypothetical protein
MFPWFASPPKGKAPEPQRVPLELGEGGRAEAAVTAERQRGTVTAVIESGKPLTEVMDRMWVVQEGVAKP